MSNIAAQVTTDTEQIYEVLRVGVIKFCCPFSGYEQKMNAPARRKLEHRHSNRELLFVLDGESQLVLGDGVYELSRGSAVLIDSWIPHSLRRNDAGGNLLHLWFYFSNNSIYARLYQVQEHGQHNMIGRVFLLPSYVHELFLCRWSQWKDEEHKNQKTVSYYLHTPFACLLEEVLFQMHRKGPQLGCSGMVDDIKLYIKSQNGHRCSLGSLEKIFGYNCFYLAHKFKHSTGVTIGSYINQVRLAYTEEAMEKGLRQKEISYNLGFSSPSAFWKWYHKNRR